MSNPIAVLIARRIMSFLDRSTLKDRLRSTQFDAVVVGGGISGAWIACQLSRLGYAIAIVERKDFASETSSASSKLLHGGIRYLQQLQFGKVRESSLERAEYLAAAPHLAQAIPFLVPTYKDLKRSKTVLNCGMAAYQALGIGQGAKLADAGLTLPQTTTLRKDELLSICDISPTGLTGAVSFPEFHLYDSERTVWSIIATAIDCGAVAANYTTVDSVVADNTTVSGVTARLQYDNETITINASLVINAAGPWIDQVINSLDRAIEVAGEAAGETTSDALGKATKEPGIHSARLLPTASVKPLTAASQTIQGYASGAHLITRQLLDDHAIAITTEQQSNSTIGRGGRHIFIIPWRGKSLIGTSYRETEDPDNAGLLLQDDMDQLLDSVNAALPSANLGPDDVISAYSGLYPLRVERIKSSLYQGSGEYLIIDHTAKDQLDGLITALGAKLTTGRILSVRTVELSERKLQQLGVKPTSGHRSANSANSTRLSSAGYDRFSDFLADQQQTLAHRFSDTQIKHLVYCYGSQIDDFVAFLDEAPVETTELLSQPIIDTQPDILGQVAWAVENEMAIHLDDVLLRRTSIGLLGINRDGLSQVASIMAKRLDWNAQTTRSEISAAIERQKAISQSVFHYYDNHQRAAGANS